MLLLQIKWRQKQKEVGIKTFWVKVFIFIKRAVTCPKNSKWFGLKGKVQGTCHPHDPINTVVGLFLLLIKVTVLPFFSIQSSLTRMALHALSRMETRKYCSGSTDSSSTREDNGNLSDAESTLSTQSEATNSKCVICLEKFKDGQVNLLSYIYVFIHFLFYLSLETASRFFGRLYMCKMYNQW